MLAADAEFGLIGHPVDLFAHFVECEDDALPFRLGILGDDVFDIDTGLVVDGNAAGEPLYQRQALEVFRPGLRGKGTGVFLVDQVGVGDQFGQYHGDRLQGLDLDLDIAARIDVLHAQHANRPLTPDDRHARKGVEFRCFRRSCRPGLRQRPCA